MTAKVTIRSLIVLEVLALLAGFAWPEWQRAAKHRRAELVARQIELVCKAAATAKVRDGNWPDDAPPGQMPAAMSNVLPQGFRFTDPTYVIDWDAWPLVGDGTRVMHAEQFVAVSLTTTDPLLRQVVEHAVRSGVECWTVGDRSTFVLADSPAPALRFSSVSPAVSPAEPSGSEPDAADSSGTAAPDSSGTGVDSLAGSADN